MGPTGFQASDTITFHCPAESTMYRASVLLLLFIGALVSAHLGHSHGVFAPASPTSDLCPQHIGAPCPYYVNNDMPDYQPGTPVHIPEEVKLKFAELTEAYIDMIVLNSPPGYNDTQGDEYDVYVC